VQPDAPTVQGAVLEAARRFLGADARVTLRADAPAFPSAGMTWRSMKLLSP